MDLVTKERSDIFTKDGQKVIMFTLQLLFSPLAQNCCHDDATTQVGYPKAPDLFAKPCNKVNKA